MKKAVVFDGDGTLWYPSKTKRAVAPHWIYGDPNLVNPLGELIVTPNTVSTLETLGDRGILRILLSACPLPSEVAIENRRQVVTHIKIDHLLDDIWVSPDRENGKGKTLGKICLKYELEPKDLVMVGDTYHWDCKAADDVGIESVLIASDYSKNYEHLMRPSRIISDIGGLLMILENSHGGASI